MLIVGSRLPQKLVETCGKNTPFRVIQSISKKWIYFMILNSILRFCCLPSSDSLLAIGLAEP